MYAIDTAEAIRKLTAADMPEAQARVIVDTFKHPDAEVATKTDLEALRQELKADNKALRQELKADGKALRQELKADIEGLRQELKADNKGLRQEFKADIKELRQEFKTDISKLQIGQTWLQWVIGLNLGLTLLIVGKLLFF